MPKFNPFPVAEYIGPLYFCDREDEINRLLASIENQRPITLYSKRRMGKTGLIKHLHDHSLSKNKYHTVYIDILNTKNDEEFASKLIGATISAIDRKKKNFFNNMIRVFSRFRPRITVDHQTGNPGIELDVANPSEAKHSLDTLFSVLRQEKKTIHIAIDEFQQIANYGNTAIDATIREFIQTSPNCQFLFSGSQRHLLLDLFNNPKKPLFRMLDQMQLHEIGYDPYFKFIKKHFSQADKEISDEVIHKILSWTKRHTYYTQVICNRLFSESRDPDMYLLEKVKNIMLKEYEMTFISYKNLLTKNQFKTLKGIALEDSVTTVRSKHFVSTYKVASSTAQQSLEFLVDKELVYESPLPEGNKYTVYDLFFAEWLKANY